LHTLQPVNPERQHKVHSLRQTAFVRAGSCEEVERSIPAAVRCRSDIDGPNTVLIPHPAIGICERPTADFQTPGQGVFLKADLQSFRKAIVTLGILGRLAASP
jgi:hypothetical protein